MVLGKFLKLSGPRLSPLDTEVNRKALLPLSTWRGLRNTLRAQPGARQGVSASPPSSLSPSCVCSVLPGEGSRLGEDVLVRVLGVVSPGHPLAPRRDPATQPEPPAHSLLGPLRARPPGEAHPGLPVPGGRGHLASRDPSWGGTCCAWASVCAYVCACVPAWRPLCAHVRPGACVRVHCLSWPFRSSQAWRGARAPGAECGPRWASFGASWSEQSWLRVSVRRNGAPLPAGESPGLHRADLRLAAPLPARPRAAPPARVSSQSQARKPGKGQVGARSRAGHTAP